MVLFGVITTGQGLVEAEHGQRQHDNHRHGASRLNIAMEGRDLYLELESPAADVAGFEHAPSTEAERASLDEAVATLQEGDRLFRFSPAADCRLHTAQVATSPKASGGLETSGHREHPGGKIEHQAAQGGPAQEPHADIQVDYHFFCAQPARLEQLSVELFTAFPAIQILDVQFILKGRQGAAELTAANRELRP
jgi:hypothetical protein